jgi:malonyl-CoA/methylmalonyl-CoA synthetase
MSENLFTLFTARFPEDQSRAFLERTDGSVLTYADLLDRSGKLANTLLALGVKPGDRVAAQVEKTPEALLLYLASLRVGAVYLPLNTAYTATEVRYFLKDAEPTVFVCSPNRINEMRTLARDLGLPQLETLGADGQGTLTDKAVMASPDFVDVARAGDDLAAILYTA